METTSRNHTTLTSSAARMVAPTMVAAIMVGVTGSHPVPQPEGLAPRVGGPAHVAEQFADLPLTFVQNGGQSHPGVRFQAQGSQYSFTLTDEQILLSFFEGPDLPTLTGAVAGPAPSQGMTLGLRFLERNPGVAVAGLERAPGTFNYLRGDDPAAWDTGLAGYTSIAYRDLWPGVDLLLRGDAGQLKYEFHVAPGARPEDIRLAYQGADGLRLDRAGGLLIETPMGVLHDAAPVSYQEFGGQRVPVDSQYLLDAEAPNEYGFVLGDHDPRRPLVIDPGIDYSTFLGGDSHELGVGIGVDQSGNAYVVGTTQSDTFPTTAGAVDGTFNGGVVDVFVARLNADGSGLGYATYLGGTPTPLRRGSGDPLEFGRGIAVDADGNAYVTGQTTSSDFPTTDGAFQTELNVLPLEQRNDATDGFAAKLSPTGGLVYSTFLGGTSLEDPDGIAIDGAGNAYVTGFTRSSDFPTTSGAVQTGHAGGQDGFVTKLNATGTGLVYSTLLGGEDNEIPHAVTVDEAGNAYVTGGTRSAGFPTTAGAFQATHNGGATTADLFDGFVTKIDATGTGLEYSTFLGGARLDVANDVTIDAGGSAYVTGGTLSPEFPTTTGAYDTTFDGTSEAFAAKIDATGSGLVYSSFLNGGSGAAIALDGDNNAWLAGGAGADGPTTADAISTTNRGGNDVWLGRLDATGSQLQFGTFVGGTRSENASSMALDASGNIYLTGTTYSSDFPTTADASDRTFAGDPSIFWGDAFVLKVAPDGASEPLPPPEPETETATFSGEVRRNRTVAHTISVEGTGTVHLHLDWDETRADLSLRARDPSGTSVLLDDSDAKPKSGTFSATVTGSYRLEVRNTTRRDADYRLTATYPVAAASPTAPTLSLLRLDPSSVTGGDPSTGMVALTAAAPPGGASVAVSSSNADAATVPASVTVPAGQTSATFTVSTSAVSANTSSTITASSGGASRTATLSVNAPSGPALSTLSLDPTTVDGGDTSTATVTLTGAAPSGGAVVTLGSSNTSVATVPASVTVPAGSTSATFTVSTSTVTVDSSSSISASHGGVTRFQILSVTAGGQSEPTPTLSSLGLSPSGVTGGGSSTGTVTLTSTAPAGGTSVTLSSSNTAVATVPASVTVASGSTTATFAVSTSSVTSDTSATITGSHGEVTRTATLSVDAAAETMDTVTISRAEYDADKDELRVEASSSNSSATLRVHVTSTNELIGTLSGGRGEFSWPSYPQTITVRSSLGGSDTRSVRLK